MLKTQKFKNKTSLADSTRFRTRKSQVQSRLQAIRQRNDIKNFLTLQMNKRVVEHSAPHMQIQKMIHDDRNVKEVFGIIYKNRFDTSRLKKDIIRLIKFDSKRRPHTQPRSKSQQPTRPIPKRGSKENETSNAAPSRRAKLTKNLKISIKKSVENFGSTMSIDRMFKTKKLVFQLDPKSTGRPRVGKKKAKTPSDDKKFALHLVKQSFMKINKDLLNVRAKENLRVLREKPESSRILLNEIFRRRHNTSYYETFSNPEDKNELFSCFVDRLKGLFHMKGFRSESVKVKTKKKLRNLIQDNIKLLTDGESCKPRQPRRRDRLRLPEPAQAAAHAEHGQRLRSRRQALPHPEQEVQGDPVEPLVLDRQPGHSEAAQGESEADQKKCGFEVFQRKKAEKGERDQTE